MSRAGKVLHRLGDRAASAELLRRGRWLIQAAHEAREADLTHELLEAGGTKVDHGQKRQHPLLPHSIDSGGFAASVGFRCPSWSLSVCCCHAITCAGCRQRPKGRRNYADFPLCLHLPSVQYLLKNQNKSNDKGKKRFGKSRATAEISPNLLSPGVFPNLMVKDSDASPKAGDEEAQEAPSKILRLFLPLGLTRFWVSKTYWASWYTSHRPKAKGALQIKPGVPEIYTWHQLKI